MTEPNLRDLVGKLCELAPGRPPAPRTEIDSSERRLGIRLSADFLFAYATLNGTTEPTPLENGWIELWPLARWVTVEQYVRDWPEPNRSTFAPIFSAVVFADYSIESWHYAAHFSATSIEPTVSIYLLHLQPHLVAGSLQGFLAAALVDGPAIYPPTPAMRLVKVEYEFFDFEEPSDAAIELARQVRLHFSDAPTLFLSWTWKRQHGPDDQPYSIEHRANSFFDDEPASVVDASKAPLWSRHVGQKVEVAYRPAAAPMFEYQVIEVRSGAASTFVFSVGLDRIGVSNTPPNLETVGRP